MATESEVRDLVARVVGELTDQAAERVGSRSAGSGVAAAAEPGEGIAIGADHGGFPLKQKLISHLRDRGHEVVDCGTGSGDSVDYPDFAHAVAQRVASGKCRWGIVVDGAGIGSSMAANKVPGVRAALCYDVSSARNSREHNHANVLTLGAGLIGEGLARQIVDTWLETPWGGGRHGKRVDKIDAIEARYSKGGHMMPTASIRTERD